jgi:Methyltransferase FkbM domain
MDELNQDPGRRVSLALPTELSFLAPFVIGEMIRVGKLNDGGYVIPRDSTLAVDTLVSLGISTDWSFEQHFKKLNPQIQVHAYDHTISEDLFRRSYQKGVVHFLLGRISRADLSERRNLFRSYRAFFSTDARHFKERIHNRLDARHDVTIDKVLERTTSNRIFLKIDIEGSEYRIINSILKNADRIVGMVIEFHDTDPLRQVFRQAVEKLQGKFNIVHFHANNFGGVAEDNLPEVLELTFAREAAERRVGRRSLLPVPGLDHPNNPRNPDYEIRFSLGGVAGTAAAHAGAAARTGA